MLPKFDIAFSLRISSLDFSTNPSFRSLSSMIFLNDKLIINSESLALIMDTVNQMILTGYLLLEQILTKPQRKVFHQQKYCKVYTMLGKVSRISEN